MWRLIRRLHAILPRQLRLQAVPVIALLVLNAALEALAIALVPLFVGMLVDPNQLLATRGAAIVSEWFGADLNTLDVKWLVAGVSGLLFLVASIRLLFVPFLSYVRNSYVNRVVRYLSLQLFGRYLSAPYEFHINRNSAELIRNASSECAQLGWKALAPLIDMTAAALMIAAVIAVLLWRIPLPALAAVCVFLVAALPLVAVLNRKTASLSASALAGRTGVLKSTQEALGGIKEIRLLGTEASFERRFANALNQVLRMQRFIDMSSRTVPVFMEWVSIGVVILVVIIVLGTAGDRGAVAASVALFAVAMVRLKSAVSVLLGRYTEIPSAVVSVEVVAADMQQLEADGVEVAQRSSAGTVGRLDMKHEIRLDDVWFRYARAPENAYALRGINLRIGLGEAIGFVGSSGAGKSTLVDVVLGILTPQKGVESVDGVDIRHDLRSWYGMVGYVPQAAFLVDGSIRQNIALGIEDGEVDEEAVWRAARAAYLDTFLAELPHGLDTVIGERGARLSGGQRQRIIVARALYRDPEVLVLDEATSALDNVTEKAVMQAVDDLKGRRTILVIAHRLSTVRNCDRIVLLDRGQVRGVGTYEELLATNEGFRRMARTV